MGTKKTKLCYKETRLNRIKKGSNLVYFLKTFRYTENFVHSKFDYILLFINQLLILKLYYSLICTYNI
jgi:hypothetical protein